MIRSVFPIAIVFALLAGGSAQAGTFDARQERQRARISEGIRSGELTRFEARRLGRQQARLERAQHRAWSDGVLGPREARRLDRAHDRASRRIFRAKHDCRSR